jgi:diaminopimelate epimerase
MSKKQKLPWQQNFLKVPANIESKVSSIPQDDVIIACVKKIPVEDIRAGNYQHLDLRFEERGVGISRACGTASHRW